MASDVGRLALHLIPAELWAAAPIDRPLRVASLETEGFVHLTHRIGDLIWVGDTFYREDRRPHVVLTVDLDRLTVPWRYDGDERFPHVYGPIDRGAIVGHRPIERAADGRFLG